MDPNSLEERSSDCSFNIIINNLGKFKSDIW